MLLTEVISEVIAEYPKGDWCFLVGEIMRRTEGIHEPWIVMAGLERQGRTMTKAEYEEHRRRYDNGCKCCPQEI
jgi:hypothetical protein